MNFRHLEVFYSVMVNGTVTAAARHLGVSQPSVTTTLKHAEAELGVQLFLREGGRLVPTEEATLLFDEAARAHDALAALTTMADGLKLGRGGHVRIAAVPTLSLDLLPDAIAEFDRRSNGYHYSVATLDTETIIEQLDTRRGGHHVGFVFGYAPDAGLACTGIGDIRLFAVLPADWSLSDSDVIDLKELDGHPYIGGFGGTAIGAERIRLFADAGIEPVNIVRGHSHRVAGALVERGLGWAILDSLTVQAMLHGPNSNAFVVRRIPEAESLRVCAVYPSQRQLSAAAALFIECFQEAFDRLETKARAEARAAAMAVQLSSTQIG